MGDPPSYRQSQIQTMSVGRKVVKREGSLAKVFSGLELVMVLIILGLVRLGGKARGPVYLGSTDGTFFTYGAGISFCLVAPCLLLSRLQHSPPCILEVFLTIVGSLQYLAIGSLAAMYEKGEGDTVAEIGRKMMEVLTGESTSLNTDGCILVLSILSFLTCLLFLADFCFTLHSYRKVHKPSPV